MFVNREKSFIGIMEPYKEVHKQGKFDDTFRNFMTTASCAWSHNTPVTDKYSSKELAAAYMVLGQAYGLKDFLFKAKLNDFLLSNSYSIKKFLDLIEEKYNIRQNRVLKFIEEYFEKYNRDVFTCPVLDRQKFSTDVEYKICQEILMDIHRQNSGKLASLDDLQSKNLYMEEFAIRLPNHSNVRDVPPAELERNYMEVVEQSLYGYFLRAHSVSSGHSPFNGDNYIAKAKFFGGRFYSEYHINEHNFSSDPERAKERAVLSERLINIDSKLVSKVFTL